MRGLKNMVTPWFTSLRHSQLQGGTTSREVFGLTLMVAGLMTTLSLLSFDANDLSLNAARGDGALIYTHNWIGPAGATWADLCFQWLGLMSWGVAASLCSVGARRLVGRSVRPHGRHIVAFALMALSLGTLIELLMVGSHTAYPLGGAFGAIVARGLRATFAPLGAALIAALGALVALALALRGTLSALAERGAQHVGLAAKLQLARVRQVADARRGTQGAGAQLAASSQEGHEALGAKAASVGVLAAADTAQATEHDVPRIPSPEAGFGAQGEVAQAILDDVHNLYAATDVQPAQVQAAQADMPQQGAAPQPEPAQPEAKSSLLSRSAAALESFARAPGLSPSDAAAGLLAPAAVLARAQGADAEQSHIAQDDDAELAQPQDEGAAVAAVEAAGLATAPDDSMPAAQRLQAAPEPFVGPEVVASEPGAPSEPLLVGSEVLSSHAPAELAAKMDDAELLATEPAAAEPAFVDAPVEPTEPLPALAAEPAAHDGAEARPLSPLAAPASLASDRDELRSAAGATPSEAELAAAAIGEPDAQALAIAAGVDPAGAALVQAAGEDPRLTPATEPQTSVAAAELSEWDDGLPEADMPADETLDASAAAPAPLAEAADAAAQEASAQAPEEHFGAEQDDAALVQQTMQEEHWTLDAEAASAASQLEQIELPPADEFTQLAEGDDELHDQSLQLATDASLTSELEREPEAVGLGAAQLSTAARGDSSKRALGGQHFHGQLAEGSFGGEPAERLAWDVAREVADGQRPAPHHAQGRAPLAASPALPYELPSVEMLSYEQTALEPLDEGVLRDNAQRLQKTLADYGIEGHVREIRPGPVVTLYEYVPGPGIKLAKIASLADDLAMSMEALRVRIVAPIPGKGAVGIEIPNDRRETVFFKEIVGSSAFSHAQSPLSMALGKDIEGAPYVADLARMPHLLVAGATGAGKSVSINAMIMSVLCKATPAEVRMIMVDPKMLELSVYEGIPHLLLPVVTDPKKAALALRWAVQEMERRYELLSEVGVRNIDGYNKRVRKGLTNDEPVTVAGPLPDGPRQACEPLPYLLVIVDELADLMMVASREVEGSIMRLAQMARAAGIHLVLATQRPSVDVITGVIKANFPTRIAFQVASRHDSRTIIDANGAEHLLGRGDMLYLSSGPGGLTRVHGCYVSEEDIEQLVAHARAQASPQYDESILAETHVSDEGGEAPEEELRDDMYDQGVAVVAQAQQVSISLIQRRLRIGYNRAARMVERMEQEGIVGPAEGAKPREVLIGDPGA